MSRVLNSSSFVEASKREAVFKAAEALQYQPNAAARSLVSGQTFAIGVVTNDIGSAFNDRIVQGIIKELHRTKYSPVIVDALWSTEAGGRVVENLTSQSVDATIFIAGAVSADNLEEQAKRKPTLVVAREIPDWKENNIFIDNFSGAYEATTFLLDLETDMVDLFIV